MRSKATKLLLSLMLVSALLMSSLPGLAATHSQGVFDDRILIGNCAATSGAFGPVGIPYTAAIEAAVMMYNEEFGGINGRKIEFIHYDDEMNPEKAMQLYDRLINDDKVFAIVGAFGTPCVGAVVPTFIEEGIPAVFFATGMAMLFNEHAVGNERVIMPVQPIYTTEGKAFAAWAKGFLNGKKVAIIYSGDDAGKGVYAGLLKGVEEFGLELVAAEQVPFGAEDVSAAVTKVLAANPDVICNGAMQNTFLTIGKELGKQGNTIPVLTSYVNAGPAYFSQFASDIKGKFEIYAPGWCDVSQGGEDLDLMGEYLEKIGAGEYKTSPYCVSGWLAVKFFATGLERLGDGPITWEAFLDAMESEPIDMGFGTGSQIDFSNGKRYGTETLALYRLDMDFPGSVEMVLDFMTMQQILDLAD